MARDQWTTMADIEALCREMVDVQKRLAKAEASIERMLAQWPKPRPTPEQLVNQTYRRERPPHYSEGADPLGR